MLTSALIYLMAAVLAVPLAKRLGLGSVLGYLIAGVLIGPYALQLVGEQSGVMHFAEFGVVMMLFLVGLELQPSRLWQLRKPILGLGGLQVLISAGVMYALIEAFTDLAWQTALVIGMTLALSSTAIVLQSLTERGLLKTQAGNNAFSVLLFQDIAVIPMLAVLPLLALSTDNSTTAEHTNNLIAHFPVWQQVVFSFITIAAIIFGGKFLSAPIFRIIADTRLRELFTAFSLLIVIAIAVLMQSIGLSPALGTFLAGVVLAESEFRHELEVDIEPFKGLLLGLFFITVGASIDFQLLAQKPFLIIGLVAALVVVKASVLALLAFLFRMPFSQGTLFAVALAQGGEFAFVIVSASAPYGVFNTESAATITLVVALSMTLSPLLLVAYEYFMASPEQQSKSGADQFEETSEVILAGYGRFGQIVGRLLTAQGYKLTILDHSPSQIDLLRRFNNSVYYGDAARKDLLHAAGAEDAKVLIIAVDEPDKTLEIIDTAQKHFPNLKILARTIDRRHTYEVMKKNISGWRRETFDSALHIGTEALQLLGVNKESALRSRQIFSDHDHQSLHALAEVWGDDKSYGVAVRQRMEDLKQVLQQDEKSKGQRDAENNA